MSRPIYSRLEDAPEPSRDGEEICVDLGNGWYRDYVARDGRWEPSHTYYPAILD